MNPEEYKRRYYAEELSEKLLPVQKAILWGVFVLGLIILSVGFSSAVECGTTPTNLCTVSVTTTFNLGTYLLNGSSTGAVNINGSNLILDCNGATIIGNRTSNALGIFYHSNNVRIRNCNVKGYGKGIAYDGGNRIIY